MPEEPLFMGEIASLDVREGRLELRFENPQGVVSMGCPKWLAELDEDRQQQWRQIEGGLYWPAIGETVQIPAPMVDMELLAEAIRELTEKADSE